MDTSLGNGGTREVAIGNTNTCGTSSCKSQIISLLSDINREGIGNVIAYLEHSDYFSAHCHHHHRYQGGLADHSLEVYWEMRAFAPDLPDESCRIVALLHDLCTTRLEGYDTIGYHQHGQRSVDLIDVLGLDLLDEELLAISHHMHYVPPSNLNAKTRLWHFLNFCDHRNANESH